MASLPGVITDSYCQKQREVEQETGEKEESHVVYVFLLKVFAMLLQQHLWNYLYATHTTLCNSLHIQFYNVFLLLFTFQHILYTISIFKRIKIKVWDCVLMYFLGLMLLSNHDSAALVVFGPAGKQGAIIAACSPSPSETPTLCVKTLYVKCFLL